MDSFVRLAKKALEEYVNAGRILNVETEDLPEELLSRRAGAFVSLKEDGMLRGCIGTIEPTRKTLAEEIICNAISAGIYDPRFPKVRKAELERLCYSVDVLEKPEGIRSEEELDPKQYGVIVTNGRRRGLLLPNLEGVDTVKDQIMISRQKAGIGPEEPVTLKRFRVVRHL